MALIVLTVMILKSGKMGPCTYETESWDHCSILLERACAVKRCIESTGDWRSQKPGFWYADRFASEMVL